ncbi:hypothetical protein RclHR1_03250009 [Rhizophagus clarus]|uniref:Uncharacterized protein n=1 Tax=Rhizophagus clarus TaxID=94130 RepID=A0A2Z6R8H5_9GLOM|nr:hypothetical protein RclHR1_03250009 [Rhizophagus clarus]GES76885.1 hypothetical protein GLOIN_2v1670599 [Rhizophagus clarus]
MFFQGYELQVLINNILLEEYPGPRKSVPYRYTSPDWVDNYQTGIRMESELLHYIFLPSTFTQFTARVSSSEASYLKPIVAEIRINGIPTHENTTSFFPSSLNPKGLSLTDPGKKQQICTLNKIDSQQLIGAVSVFFYKAESLFQKKSEIPLAVLHLHYRSKDMFMNLIQNRVINFIPIHDYVENKDNVNHENNVKEINLIQPEGGFDIYDNVFNNEPLNSNEQIQYNNNGEFQGNVREQPRNMEIIEILDD